MNPIFIVLITLIFSILGFAIVGRPFNHLTLYSLVWGLSLFSYSLKWVNFYDLCINAWLYIFIAWILLYIGSATYKFMDSFKIKRCNVNKKERNNLIKEKYILSIILLLSFISLISIVQQWLILFEIFGSLPNVIKNANKIRTLFVSGELDKGIPYLSSLALSASCFAGYYIAKYRKFNFVLLLPLFFTFISNLASFSRAGILLAFSLYVIPYLIEIDDKFFTIRNLKKVLYITILSGLLIVLTSYIKTVRGGIEDFSAYTNSTSPLNNMYFIKPSIYVYISSPPVVFSKFLELDIEKSIYPGAQTLAPIFRLFSKIHLIEENIPYYQMFYNTPIPINTGTYLRDLYMDFGVFGILFLPYFLGLFAQLIYMKYIKYDKAIYSVIYIYILLFLEFSFTCSMTYTGYFLISFLISLIFAKILDYTKVRG